MSQEQLDGLTAGAMVMIVASKAERAKLEALTIAMLRALPRLGDAILEALEATSKVNRDDGWEEYHKDMYDEMVEQYRKTVEIFSEADKI